MSIAITKSTTPDTGGVERLPFYVLPRLYYPRSYPLRPPHSSVIFLKLSISLFVKSFLLPEANSLFGFKYIAATELFEPLMPIMSLAPFLVDNFSAVIGM